MFTLAGYTVEGATSWHIGYPLLLSPIARFVSDAQGIWAALVALNSLLFVGSMVLLKDMLQRIFPEKSEPLIFIAVFISSFYPAWMVMAGYAFPTPFFVFMMMALIFVLLRLSSQKVWMLILAGSIAGFLYWIHPVGLAFVGAVIMVYGWQYISAKKYVQAVLISASAILVTVLYAFLVHPWINDVMTTSLQNETNSGVAYGFLADNLDLVTPQNLITRTPIFLFGQLAYLLVGTFGIAAAFLYPAFKNTRSMLFSRKKISEREVLQVVLLTALIGVLVISVSTFYVLSLRNQIRPDHLVYGRYVDMLLLPILGISILIPVKKSQPLVTISVIAAAALIITNGSPLLNIDYTNYDAIHTPSFWPVHFIDRIDYAYWLLLGAMGAMLASSKYRYFLPLLILPFLLIIIQRQQEWHDFRYSFAAPSGLAAFVEKSIEEDGKKCIGFDAPDSTQSQRDRIELYKYYLARHQPQKMSYIEWSDSQCGAYITTRFEKDAEQNDHIISYEESSGLYVMTRQPVERSEWSTDNFFTAFYSNTTHSNNECAVKGCFDRSAVELAPFLEGGLSIGAYEEGSIINNGKKGLLIFGPYTPLKKGDYVLTMDMRVDGPFSAEVEFSSTAGPSIANKNEPIEQKDGRYIIPFSLEKDVTDLQIKIILLDYQEAELRHYSIELEL